MVYLWVKTVVGVLLTVNFCVPLATVVSNRYLWEEPMAVLAGNMSLTSTLMGSTLILVGIYDLTGLEIVALCRLQLYSGIGAGIAFKVAQVGAAVDQFVAVVHPLHHYLIMMRAQPWLLAATWLTFAVHMLFGLVAHMMDLETFSENAARQSNSTAFTGCRWETALANVYTIVGELELVTFSLVTASLLIYTGFVGYRVRAQLANHERQRCQDGIRGNNDSQTFLDNYRAFKYIMTVLSLTVSMDIVAAILRISSRWYPQPKLNGMLQQARNFGFIFEGWAYGLLNAKLRAAYKKTLCRRCRRVENAVIEQSPPPIRSTAPPAAAAAAPLELISVGSAEAGGATSYSCRRCSLSALTARSRGEKCCCCRRHRLHDGSLGEPPLHRRRTSLPILGTRDEVHI